MLMSFVLNWKKVYKIEWLSTLGYCIYIILLPFGIKYNNIGIITLSVLLLPELFKRPSLYKKCLYSYFNSFYPLIIYYLYLCISFYSVHHLNPEGQHLETRTGMVALPLLLSFVGLKSKKEIIAINLSFIFTISILSVLGIISYVKYIILYKEVSTWILVNKILVLHRPIWGLYLLGSLILTFHLLNEVKVDKRFTKALIIVSLLNIFFLILSQAKNSIIALFLIIGHGVLYNTIRGKKIKNIKYPLAAFTVLVLFLFTVFLFYNERYFFFLSEGIKISVDYRITQWSCAFSSIKENWLLGAGTGLDRFALDQCYISVGRKDLVGFNTHNQFLNLLLESGIAGLLLILFWLVKLFYHGLKNQKKSLLYWIIVIVIAMMTENIFSTQKALLITFSILSLTLFQRDHISFKKDE